MILYDNTIGPVYPEECI